MEIPHGVEAPESVVETKASQQEIVLPSKEIPASPPFVAEELAEFLEKLGKPAVPTGCKPKEPEILESAANLAN